MRYYLVTKENSTKDDPFQVTTDRSTGIIHIQPLAEKFSIQMINRFLRSVSVELQLTNSDKQRLDKTGMSLVFQYPKNQLWVYDINHHDNNFLKAILREARIYEII